MKVYKNGSALVDGKLVKTDIAVNMGRIIEIAEQIVPDDQTEVIDVTNKFILPALVELFAYGGCGYTFADGTKEQMKQIVELYASHGVGTVFPTLTGASEQQLITQLQALCELSEELPEVKGFGLDDVFVNPDYVCEKRREFVQPCDIDFFCRLQDACKKRIKIVVVSPEKDGAVEFVKELTARKVSVVLGRSNATKEQTLACIKAGAKACVFFGKANFCLDAESDNFATTAMLSDLPLVAVCDGKHISTDWLKALVKLKGVEKFVGTTATSNRYLPCHSTLQADDGLAYCISSLGLPLVQAVKAWTTTPAKIVKLDDYVGTVEVGKDGDFIILG